VRDHGEKQENKDKGIQRDATDNPPGVPSNGHVGIVRLDERVDEQETILAHQGERAGSITKNISSFAGSPARSPLPGFSKRFCQGRFRIKTTKN